MTVTDVRLTGDSRDASVFYTVLGDDADYASTAAALQSATGLIRSQVGKQLGLHFTPTLAFIPDVVPESARQLDEALAAAREVDARVAAGRGGGDLRRGRRPVQARRARGRRGRGRATTRTGSRGRPTGPGGRVDALTDRGTSAVDALPADARPPVPSGVVVVDKAAGLTSHGVVARVRRLLGTRKVGHAGTLDPMATGVLVVGVERATRLLGHLTLTDKTYDATIRLGVGTVTDDAEGDVIATPGLTGARRRRCWRRRSPPLRGPILQVPTAVSAIKVDGVRSYARVRAGEEVALVPRPVTVHRFDVLARRDDEVDGVAVVDLDVVVDCSSGTYVRALARDLGAALGSAGHLTALRRTRVGPFTLDEAVVLPEPGTRRRAPAGRADRRRGRRRCFPVVRLDAAGRRPTSGWAGGCPTWPRRADRAPRPGRDVPRALPPGPGRRAARGRLRRLRRAVGSRPVGLRGATPPGRRAGRCRRRPGRCP